MIQQEEFKKATIQEALDICRKFELIAPNYGCHVALTGGTLYKDGPRKDIDILFYRIRQVDEIDYAGLFEALKTAYGLSIIKSFGWVTKASIGPISLDLFFPEDDSAPNDSSY